MKLPHDTPCPHCGRYNNRRIAVDAYIVRSNKILLIKRGAEPFKGFWSIPGGGIDFDETAEDALKKEVLEETGLKVTDYTFVNYYTDPARSPNQSIALAFLVNATGTPEAGDDAIDVGWFPLDELPDPLAFDHKKIIEDCIKAS